MAELNQRTTAIHGLRRVTNEVMADTFEGDVFVCQQQLASLQLHFDRFTAAQDHLVGEAVDDTELNAHQALWDEMEALYNPAVVKLNRIMAVEEPQSAPASQGGQAESIHTNVAAMMNLKLDPVTIPQFDGSLRNWLAFKDAIQTLLDKPEIPEYYKLQKLRASLVGDSLTTLVGNLYTGGYRATWEELVRRYDNKKQLAELHVSRFVGIKPVTNETGAGLLKVVDTVRESLRALRVMELPVDQWDALSVPIVTSKLPQVTQHAWGMHTDQRELPNLDELLSFVEKRAQSLSLDVLHWPGTTTNNAAGAATRRGASNATTNASQTQRLVKSNLAATAPGNCEFCDENTHRIGRCPTLTTLSVAERFTKLRGSNLCFNCLKPGHSTKSCPPTNGNCRHCHGRHHSLLCRAGAAAAGSTNTSTPAITPTPTPTPVPAVLPSQPPRNLPA